jgi:uncharacterized integral membrane protein
VSYETTDQPRGGENQPGSGTSGPPVKLIVFLLAAVALAVFFFQNTHKAGVEFLWMDANWPVWAIIGVSAVLGAILAKLAGWMWQRARRDRY